MHEVIAALNELSKSFASVVDALAAAEREKVDASRRAQLLAEAAEVLASKK
jgi:hypothetical protein